MDNNTISFIYCVNNDMLYENSIDFISQLNIPIGYNVEVIQIKGAKSISSGYNEGMKKARGKYKVYLHQDVYIINQNFIKDIIDIFENDNIGIIGCSGSKDIPDSLVWWESKSLFGKVYEIRNSNMKVLNFNNPTNKYEEVSLLDGFILITQYDIKWREDVFDGWHFYDISQSLEFKKQNKKVVVAYQQIPWCIHDCGIVSMDNYYVYRDKLVKEYFK